MNLTTCLEDCLSSLKSRLFSTPEQSAIDQALVHFTRGSLIALEQGEAFEWSKKKDDSAKTAMTGAIMSLLATVKPQSDESFKVLVRLAMPAAAGVKVAPALLTNRLANLVTGAGSARTDDTALVWSTLELEKNVPRFSGRVPLHAVQMVREQNGELVVLDHLNNVLFRAKSGEAKKWVAMLEEARVVLAPQIEEEAIASRGLTYRSEKLELLEQRQKQREEMKKKLGTVTMEYTAKAMMRDAKN